MPSKETQTTHNQTRYQIRYQIIKGKRQPFAYFGETYAFNLLHMSIHEAEHLYLEYMK